MEQARLVAKENKEVMEWFIEPEGADMPINMDAKSGLIKGLHYQVLNIDVLEALNK